VWYGTFVHGYSPAAHHKEWIDALVDDSLGHTLIVAPPRHAKTTWLMMYCLWWLGNHPEKSVGYLSNTATQAYRQSMAIRDTVMYSPEYKAAFPNVRPDEKRKWAADEWFLERKETIRKDASLTASGTPGPILGSEFNRLIFDDVCDQENMASEKMRQNTLDWLSMTAMSRLSPDGRAICIMTRWHHEDWAAWCIKRGWHLIHMPAIGYWEEGAPLWPDEWPLLRLGERLDDLGSWAFEGMYQGRPTPLAGAIFKRDWFRYYDFVPDLQMKVCSWDTAYKTGEQNAYTAGVVFGVDGSGNIYILDITRRRMEYPDVKRQIPAVSSEWGAPTVLIEDAASGQAAVQELKNTPDVNVIPVRATRDKVARANAVAPLFQAGRIYLPSPEYAARKGIRWVQPYEAELLECPNGRFWDQVDVTAQFADWYRERALGRPEQVRLRIVARA